MGCFDPRRLRDPVVAQARRNARLTLLVAVCALRGQGGACDPATIRAIAEDPRMTPRLQRRAATVLLRLGLPPGLGLAWNRGRP